MVTNIIWQILLNLEYSFKPSFWWTVNLDMMSVNWRERKAGRTGRCTVNTPQHDQIICWQVDCRGLVCVCWECVLQAGRSGPSPPGCRWEEPRTALPRSAPDAPANPPYCARYHNRNTPEDLWQSSTHLIMWADWFNSLAVLTGTEDNHVWTDLLFPY